MRMLTRPYSFRLDPNDLKVLKENRIDIAALIRHAMRRYAQEIKEMQDAKTRLSETAQERIRCKREYKRKR